MITSLLRSRTAVVGLQFLKRASVSRSGSTNRIVVSDVGTHVTSRDQKRSASNTDETEFPSEDKTNDETGNEGGNTLNNTAVETISWRFTQLLYVIRTLRE